MLKPLTVWITRNWKILNVKIRLPYLPPDLHAGQEATVRTRHGAMVWIKTWKEVTAVYCDSAYLTSMQSASCRKLGWMNHKLESRFPEEI